MKVNDTLKIKEKANRKFFKDHPNYDLPYPHLDDMNLQQKLTLKKEFRYKYDGEIKDVNIGALSACKKQEIFELSPHQEFIKRFISYQSPYNGVLLFHGLGSGKTCSAIGITESIRVYSKYIHNFKRILIIASPNVQENFKLQLFDPSNLKKINDIWSIRGCLGNSLIKELNIEQINNLTKEELIHKIHKLINNYYDFTGYIEFANRIQKCIVQQNGAIQERPTQKKLKSAFEDTLIIIDEIHNIRINTDVKSDKKISKSLYTLVKYVKYLKFVFLTGTPMYNDPKEILFILNILNMNDNRSIVQIKDIFDENGEFIVKGGVNIGKELFAMKANGYVSYVRGENPYSFPYLIMPHMYKDPHSIKILAKYPSVQFNKKPITGPIKYIDVFVTPLSKTQEAGYTYFVDKVIEKVKDQQVFEQMDSFRYSIIQSPIQALNIVYPVDDGYLTGNVGLESVMKYVERQNPPSKNGFEYTRMNGMFAYNKIGEYSHKIKTILDNIINSTGIILIYSGYIDGGIVPMALALEHIGFTRYGSSSKSLFKNKQYTDKDKEQPPMKNFKYSIICGEKPLSPNNNEEIDALTHNNTNGERVKVVIISQAGSEGIDLKNIRQVHIMEPWYNMNRIEQIIGRARRNCSHKELPLNERNVQIFLHCSSMPEVETMDMYLYRLSEKKSIKIGQVSRLLKSVSIDCILNKEQQAFAHMTQRIKLKTSDVRINTLIDYKLQDEPFSVLCDYSDSCEYECINKVTDKEALDKTTYQYPFTQSNKVLERIKQLFKIKYVYKRAEINKLVITRGIHMEEVDRALHDLELETLTDKYGRKGNLIHTTDLYFFHPIELKDKHVTMFERITPIQHKDMQYKVGIDFAENNTSKEDTTIMVNVRDKYTRALENNENNKTDDDWYNFFDSGIEYLKEAGITQKVLHKYLIAHICEQLSFHDEMEMLNDIYSKDGELETLIKKYYDQFMFKSEGIEALFLVDILSTDEKEHILILDGDRWRESTYTEREVMVPLIKKKFGVKLAPEFTIIGFMGFNNKTGTFEFKIKNKDDTRTIGALIENKPKKDILNIIETTIGEAGIKSQLSHKKKNELCVLEEILLRHYDTMNVKNARCFLNKIEIYYLNKN